MCFAGYAVTNFVFFYIFTKGDNFTCPFMSKNMWKLLGPLTWSVTTDNLWIGTADSNRMNFTQYFIRTWYWYWYFLKFKFILCGQHHCFHFFSNILHIFPPIATITYFSTLSVILAMIASLSIPYLCII